MTKKVHAVGVIFENDHGQILVLRRHPQDLEGTTWGLVGDKVEPGKVTKTAAIREVHEEIGRIIEPSKMQFLGVLNIPLQEQLALQAVMI